MKHMVGYEWFGFLEDQKSKLFNAIVDECQPGLSAMFKAPSRKPWVAQITGLSQQYKFNRDFVAGQFEGEDANAAFSRGVQLYFIIEEGQIYEVCYFTSWRNKERYFCSWSDGVMQQLTEQEVINWLTNPHEGCSTH